MGTLILSDLVREQLDSIEALGVGADRISGLEDRVGGGEWVGQVQPIGRSWVGYELDGVLSPWDKVAGEVHSRRKGVDGEETRHKVQSEDHSWMLCIAAQTRTKERRSGGFNARCDAICARAGAKVMEDVELRSVRSQRKQGAETFSAAKVSRAI